MADHQKAIKAEQVEIVDSDGLPRIVLGLRGGQPSIEILRRNGSSGISVGLLDDQKPSITLRDLKGRVRAEIRLFDDDGLGGGDYPSIILSGYDGRARTYMTATPDGYGEVATLDDNRGVVLLSEVGMTD